MAVVNKGKHIGYVVDFGRVYEKQGICTLYINETRLSYEELAPCFLPCYHKQLKKVYEKGLRKVVLGKFLGHGASRYVFQHPTCKSLVVKLDIKTFSRRKSSLLIDNQNMNEYIAFKKIEYTQNKVMLGLLAKITTTTDKYFMVVQKKAKGKKVSSLRMDYQTKDDVMSKLKKSFFKQLSNEFGRDYSWKGYDFHGENMMQHGKKFKIVDLGFIADLPREAPMFN